MIVSCKEDQCLHAGENYYFEMEILDNQTNTTAIKLDFCDWNSSHYQFNLFPVDTSGFVDFQLEATHLLPEAGTNIYLVFSYIMHLDDLGNIDEEEQLAHEFFFNWNRFIIADNSYFPGSKRVLCNSIDSLKTLQSACDKTMTINISHPAFDSRYIDIATSSMAVMNLRKLNDRNYIIEGTFRSSGYHSSTSNRRLDIENGRYRIPVRIPSKEELAELLSTFDTD